MLSKPFKSTIDPSDPLSGANSPAQTPNERELSAYALRPGILPIRLLEQVANTVEWCLPGSPGFSPAFRSPPEPHLQEIQNAYALTLQPGLSGQVFLRTRVDRRSTESSHPLDIAYEDHYAYFKLLLSAHHLTCASFTPTDVDVSIREKLWHSVLEQENYPALGRMINLVLESRTWPTERVSRRYVHSPKSGEILTGQQGEWFSTIAAAYGTLKRVHAQKASPSNLAKEDLPSLRDLASVIYDELLRQHQVFCDALHTKDGILLLKSAVLLAHNLGDLKRVFEAWKCDQDSLLLPIYRLAETIESKAGELNRQIMAAENHRHLPLREPKILRSRPEFLLGLGPFFYEWGFNMGTLLDPETATPVVDALLRGWERYPTTFGYPRALLGIIEATGGGAKSFQSLLPARLWRTLTNSAIKQYMQGSNQEFEASFARRALKRVS